MVVHDISVADRKPGHLALDHEDIATGPECDISRAHLDLEELRNREFALKRPGDIELPVRHTVPTVCQDKSRLLLLARSASEGTHPIPRSQVSVMTMYGFRLTGPYGRNPIINLMI